MKRKVLYNWLKASKRLCMHSKQSNDILQKNNRYIWYTSDKIKCILNQSIKIKYEAIK